MTRNLKLSELAVQDLQIARAWYKSLRLDLASDFMHSIEDALVRIQNNPEGHMLVNPPFRRALVRRFSFAIFYRLVENTIIVSAILHTSRSPETWKKRLN